MMYNRKEKQMYLMGEGMRTGEKSKTTAIQSKSGRQGKKAIRSIKYAYYNLVPYFWQRQMV